jgi:hypothetical protein
VNVDKIEKALLILKDAISGSEPPHPANVQRGQWWTWATKTDPATLKLKDQDEYEVELMTGFRKKGRRAASHFEVESPR